MKKDEQKLMGALTTLAIGVVMVVVGAFAIKDL